jgi:hypothetical protein
MGDAKKGLQMLSDSERPIPDYPPPEGQHFEAFEEADRWKVGAGKYTKCRRSSRTVQCDAMPVARLRRGRGGHCWAYCADHMFGRWIENGKVMTWRPVPDSIPS